MSKNRRRVLVGASTMLAAAALVAPASAGAQAPSEPAVTGTLLFTRGGALYSIRADGSGLKALGRGRTDAAFSPDGTRIAFVSNFDIYTMAANGTNVTRVTTSTRSDHSPTWSSDGRQIAFNSCSTDPPYQCDIYRLQSTVPYGRAVKLTNAGANPNPGDCRFGETNVSWDSRPDWRPRTTQLAAAALCWYDGEPGSDVPGTISSQNGAHLASFSGDLSQPDWSPTGSQLVWIDWAGYDDGLDPRLVRMSATGGSRVYLTARSENASEGGRWSPDGSSIAYTRGFEIWVVNASGTSRRKLVANAALEDWGR